MAAALRWAAALTADDAYDDIENHGDEPVSDDALGWSLFDTNPRSTWAATLEWRRRAARAYDDLADDIDAGIWPLPRCTAEELALHTLLIRLMDWTSDRDAFSTLWDELASLPTHPDDENWRGAWEHLSRNDDALGSYIDPAAQHPSMLARAVWFEEFAGTAAREPARGFRR